MVKITSESSADLNELFDKYGIGVIPLSVNLDGKDYLDGVDIFPQDIFKAYEEKKILPKTAALSPENYKDFFRPIRESGAEIVHFALSSKITTNCGNAQKAGDELGGVYVVDTHSLSSGMGPLVLYAAELAQKGLSAKEIYDRVNARVPKVQASFVVDTMEYLHKGGRCSGLANFAATLLKIKPTILLVDGEMKVGQKYMGSSFAKSIIKYVDNTLHEFDNPDYTRIFVTHSYAEPDVVEAVKAEIRSKAPQFKEIIETKAGATITAHCGRGTLGILYINDGGADA